MRAMLLLWGTLLLATPKLQKTSLGVVPQELAIYPDLSARENLVFWGKMYGLRGATLKARVDEVLEIIGLTGPPERPCRQILGRDETTCEYWCCVIA